MCSGLVPRTHEKSLPVFLTCIIHPQSYSPSTNNSNQISFWPLWKKYTIFSCGYSVKYANLLIAVPNSFHIVCDSRFWVADVVGVNEDVQSVLGPLYRRDDVQKEVYWVLQTQWKKSCAHMFRVSDISWHWHILFIHTCETEERLSTAFLGVWLHNFIICNHATKLSITKSIKLTE